jgi:hypothetical protein
VKVHGVFKLQQNLCYLGTACLSPPLSVIISALTTIGAVVFSITTEFWVLAAMAAFVPRIESDFLSIKAGPTSL